MLTATLKPKKCKARGCGRVFEPARPMQSVCSPVCGLVMARAKREQDEAEAKRQERNADRKKREEFKSLGELRAEAQSAFNLFIRLRDADKPCICCGQPLGEQRFGGSYDAGHYLSRGSSPNLAFDERNTNGQRKSCNRPGGTTREKFRAGMVARWGLAVVEELEADHTPRQYRRDDLRAIRDEYRAKARALRKERGL